jgi:hypothetical protein
MFLVFFKLLVTSTFGQLIILGHFQQTCSCTWTLCQSEQEDVLSSMTGPLYAALSCKYVQTLQPQSPGALYQLLKSIEPGMLHIEVSPGRCSVAVISRHGGLITGHIPWLGTSTPAPVPCTLTSGNVSTVSCLTRQHMTCQYLSPCTTPLLSGGRMLVKWPVNLTSGGLTSQTVTIKAT